MVNPKNGDLYILADRLEFVIQSDFGHTQQKIAEKVGLSQSFVSRALNKQLVRKTARVIQLMQFVNAEYANIRVSKVAAKPRNVEEAINSYLAAGGDANLLVKQVELLREARTQVRRSLVRRAE
jgi:transcriptional regulator with XRE-family HTH domain